MTDELTREQRMEWMAVWVVKHGLTLNLEGEIGFGRECVNISKDGSAPSYQEYDDDFNRVDQNGEVWTPPHAYHKGPYVAVLGRGEEVEKELYEWLRWFDANGFVVESGTQEIDPKIPAVISILLNKHRFVKMVKKQPDMVKQETST